jgi:hypothetical protein
VLPNGDLDVTEDQEYVFNGDWNGGYRDLPIEGGRSYPEVQLSSRGQPYRQGSVTNKGGFILEMRGQTLRVKWRSRNVSDPPYNNEHVPFTLKYRVRGALAARGQSDELHWKALFPDRDAQVDLATVRVELPRAFDAAKVRREILSPGAKAEPVVARIRAWKFSARNVPPGNALDFRISWPAGGSTCRTP